MQVIAIAIEKLIFNKKILKIKQTIAYKNKFADIMLLEGNYGKDQS